MRLRCKECGEECHISFNSQIDMEEEPGMLPICPFNSRRFTIDGVEEIEPRWAEE